MIHVLKKKNTSSVSIISKFWVIGAATVYEASGRQGYVSHLVKPMRSGMKVCGPALTVQCMPNDNIMLDKAIEVADRGDVIIAVTNAEPEYAFWGSNMSVAAMTAGVDALVIDGCVRDAEEIAEMGFNVFCRGVSMKRWSGESSLGLINYPIAFGGAVVEPGDLVLGDDDGIVIVKHSECEEILKKSLERVEAEKKKVIALKSGISSVEYDNLQADLDRLGLVEEK